MSVTEHVTEQVTADSRSHDRWVGLDGLVCPGCAEPVLDAPPCGWPAGAGRAPGWSHRDGSVLCPDASGRVGEPVEHDEHGDAEGPRYWLTEAGARALDDGSGTRS